MSDFFTLLFCFAFLQARFMGNFNSGFGDVLIPGLALF
jgi:hypothetical protein